MYVCIYHACMYYEFTIPNAVIHDDQSLLLITRRQAANDVSCKLSSHMYYACMLHTVHNYMHICMNATCIPAKKQRM